jgi:hypothetical protein
MAERKVVPFDEFYYQLKLMHLFLLHPVYTYIIFKILLKVSVEESIVNASQRTNPNNAKSKVRFKQLLILTCGAFTIDSSTPTLRRNLNEHPIHTCIHKY